jgi:hypothetical protein
MPRAIIRTDKERKSFEIELLTEHIDTLEREMGTLSLDDPDRTKTMKEISRLSALRRSLKVEEEDGLP